MSKVEGAGAYASYFKAKVEFYEGNYEKASRYAKDVRELSRLSSTQAQSNEFASLFPYEKGLKGFLDYIISISEVGKGFKEAETDHFKIRYIHPKDFILMRYAGETLERAYFEIGSDLDVYPSEKVIVEIYPDLKSFTLASTLSEKEVATTGVVGVCKFNRVMIVTPRMLPRGYPWLDTLSHEYTHYLVFLKSEDTCPVWLHEGIAKFEEERWRSKKVEVMTPFYETLLFQALKDESLVPIEKMHPSFGKLESAREAQLAFAQVSTIVDFLVKRWGKKVLAQVLDEMRNGEDYETALENIIGISFPKLYAAWTEDLDKRGLEEKVTNIEVEELKFKEAGKKVTEEDDLKEIDNSQARDYVRLGDMLRGRGRLKAALFEYEKANNFDPYSPFIVNRTAFTELSLGIYEKAEEKLIESLKLYPDFVTTYMNLGRVYFKKENFTKAREAYERAISINPFDPEAHIALVSIYERFNMSDKVEIEKEVLKTLVKEESQ